MSWRMILRSLPHAVPAGEEPSAIGELEAAKAALYARLANGRERLDPHDDQPPRQEPEADRLLSVSDVAQRLGVPKRWIYDHADDLPFTKRLGRRTLRFSEKGLLRYLATHR